jgi:hypothetical protein
MGESELALRSARVVATPLKDDVRAGGIGKRTHRGGRVVRPAVVVDADAGEVVAEPGGHLGTCLWFERPPGTRDMKRGGMGVVRSFVRTDLGECESEGARGSA